MTLKIFLSYASEDEPFANAIADRLTNAFRQGILLTFMSHFERAQLGENYRNLIDKSLDEADILLVLATGRQKPSHSFTGYEVGFFRKSAQDRKLIAGTKDTARLIIPIGLFADIPATVSELEGLGITKKDLFLFDRDSAGKIPKGRADKFLDLLTKIGNILNKLEDVDQTWDQQQKAQKNYREESEGFYRDLNALMSWVPRSRQSLTTRVTLRLPPDMTAKNAEICDRVLVSCNGPTAGVFEREQSEDFVPWSVFAGQIGSDEVAQNWSDALCSLVTGTAEGGFAEADQPVFSYDQRKVFHLFALEARTYVDGTRELDASLVEHFQTKETKDLFATYLATAIAVSMGYRSLFLEDTSPYGRPFAFCRKEERKAMTNQLMRQLRQLLTEARAGRLGDRRHVAELFGSDETSIAAVQAMMKTSQEQREKLYKTAKAVMNEPELSDATFKTFIDTLDEFRTQTRDITTTFMSKVLQRLEDLVREGRREKAAREPPASHAA